MPFLRMALMYHRFVVIVWRYPSMTQVAQLQGHTYRVLYLAGSPDVSILPLSTCPLCLAYQYHLTGTNDRDGRRRRNFTVLGCVPPRQKREA